MPSTNLDFNVIAKTNQARADLDLLKAQFKQLDNEARALARGLAQAGISTPSAELLATRNSAEALRRQIVPLEKELKGTAVAMAEVGTASAFTARSFRSFEGAIKAIGTSFAGARAGLAGFAATVGAQQLAKAIDDTVKGLEKIQQTASNTNLKPSEVKAYQEIMLRAGIATDQSAASLDTFAKVLQEARIKAGAFGNDLKVNVMRGSEGAASGIIRLGGETGRFIEVIRGGQPAIKDLSDPLGQLGVNVKRLENGFMGVRIAAAQAVQEMEKVSKERAAGLGAAVFGPDWEKETKALVAFANSPAWAQLKQQGANIISPEDQKRIEDYNKAWGDLQVTWDNLKIDALLASFPAINFVLKDTAGFIKDSIAEWNRLTAAISAAVSAAGRFIASIPLPPSSLDQSPGLVPYAAGGYIRGPGSGTSDSILARLSNGEFVMRAAAVDAWGPRFMMALNNLRNPFGYAAGGLVRAPRFAAGGMVTATTSDGVTVNLQFPGGSFALRGDREIVGGLTREARRAGMLSAGRMAGALA
jgi:hypothetical protein